MASPIEEKYIEFDYNVTSAGQYFKLHANKFGDEGVHIFHEQSKKEAVELIFNQLLQHQEGNKKELLFHGRHWNLQKFEYIEQIKADQFKPLNESDKFIEFEDYKCDSVVSSLSVILDPKESIHDLKNEEEWQNVGICKIGLLFLNLSCTRPELFEQNKHYITLYVKVAMGGAFYPEQRPNVPDFVEIDEELPICGNTASVQVHYSEYNNITTMKTSLSIPEMSEIGRICRFQPTDIRQMVLQRYKNPEYDQIVFESAAPVAINEKQQCDDLQYEEKSDDLQSEEKNDDLQSEEKSDDLQYEDKRKYSQQKPLPIKSDDLQYQKKKGHGNWNKSILSYKQEDSMYVAHYKYKLADIEFDFYGCDAVMPIEFHRTVYFVEDQCNKIKRFLKKNKLHKIFNLKCG